MENWDEKKSWLLVRVKKRNYDNNSLKKWLHTRCHPLLILLQCTSIYDHFLYTILQEQSEQYAATIVALEDKLLKLMDKCKTLQNENIELAEKLNMETTTCQREVKGMYVQVNMLWHDWACWAYSINIRLS